MSNLRSKIKMVRIMNKNEYYDRLNKYNIQVSYGHNYKKIIIDSYEIEESTLDKAINKAQKMLSDKCNVDINDVFVDGVELIEGKDEEYECEWEEPEHEIPIRI